MKKYFASAFAGTILLLAGIHAQVRFPSPSPTQTIRQEFGLGAIDVVYSRPSAKGRRVFGDLVPYGKLWRTGANGATRIHFSEPVELNGRKLDSGSYSLYTIPGEESWEVILNRGISNSGSEGYKEQEDALRFKTEVLKPKIKAETFTIQFENIKRDSCELHLLWERKLVVIQVTVNVKEKLRAQIEAAMLTGDKPYWEAAQYYNEYERNFNKAVEYANKATEANPKAYWMFLYKAKIQQEVGDYAGALASSKISLALAQDAKNDDYIKMNERLQKDLKDHPAQ